MLKKQFMVEIKHMNLCFKPWKLEMRKHIQFTSLKCYTTKKNKRIKTLAQCMKMRFRMFMWVLNEGGKRTPWHFITSSFSFTLIWSSSLNYSCHPVVISLRVPHRRKNARRLWNNILWTHALQDFKELMPSCRYEHVP